MTNGVLLDTSAVIPHLRRDDSITRKLAAADYLYLPIVVLGELLFGAYRLSFPERQIEKIQMFLRAVTVLGIGTNTADQFGRISADLSNRGQNIPTNDVWVAALGCEHQLPVATQDEHFSRVSGLTVLRW
jgi:tRNA(fMet)-specific endonuclease VapC